MIDFTLHRSEQLENVKNWFVNEGTLFIATAWANNSFLNLYKCLIHSFFLSTRILFYKNIEAKICERILF